MTTFDREQALAQPETYFRHPREVLALSECSREDKIAILLNWQRSLVQLQAASEENMLADGAGRSDVSEPLAAVTQALSELGHKSDPATASRRT
jgi:hypothetical protein